jgi:hypothetical protein
MIEVKIEENSLDIKIVDEEGVKNILNLPK